MYSRELIFNQFTFNEKYISEFYDRLGDIVEHYFPELHKFLVNKK